MLKFRVDANIFVIINIIFAEVMFICAIKNA